MSSRHSGLLAVTMVLLASLATSANAAVLWDQSNWNVANPDGSLNLSSTSCSQISGNTKLHTANDVSFAQPVIINTVRIYESAGNVQAATQAYLWIAPKTGPVPTASSADVNNAANIVSITSAVVGGAVVVTATGLNIALPAGDYWVSLTPRHSRGIFPYSIHYITSGPIVGSPTYSIEACVVNSNWLQVLPTPNDYAIKIEGELPVPAIQSTWGGVKSLYR